MNKFLHSEFFHNSIENWLIALGIILCAIVFARLIYRIINFIVLQLTSRTHTKLDDIIVERLRKPSVFGIILLGLWSAFEYLQFTPKIDKTIDKAFAILTVFILTWLIVRITNELLKEFLGAYSLKNYGSTDTPLVRVSQQTITTLVWGMGIVVGLNNIGFDVGALIAGLGIGGLAFALAAQHTIKNMFGGAVLFFDKPFEVGDRIIIDEFDGVVTDIGIRRTIVRTLEGRLVTIPNGFFSEKAIVNFSKGPFERIVSKISLVYSTTPEEVETAIVILQEIGKEKREFLADDAVAFLENLSAYSLDLKFIYFLKLRLENPRIRTEINTEILTRFNHAGLKFAYPTQQIIVEKQ
ncbi:MAG: mechanosensitive ion channel family protein [Chitinophagales bacterium]|nr:mechanosensitive ion channel family protein [Chitinophagales bacterium]OJV25214.1 MAG: hypothetical protein BGO32_04575 [Bacteroidetes bacterium 37-13]